MNIDIGDDGSVKVSAAAYVKAKAEFYLPKPLADYPRFDTPSYRRSCWSRTTRRPRARSTRST
eukprot:7580-Pleurochrysis_carterae.AAC.1